MSKTSEKAGVIIGILTPGSPSLSVDRLAAMIGSSRETVFKLCQGMQVDGFLELTYPKKHQHAKNQGQWAFRNADRSEGGGRG